MNKNDFRDDEALRLAAPAPEEEAADAAPTQSDEDRDLDMLCEQWVNWTRQRRLYGPAPIAGTVLGRLRGSTVRAVQAGGPDAPVSAELSAFHLAYLCQAPETLGRQVFDLYYVQRVKPVKVAADALSISRKHFYDVLKEVRKRIFAGAQALLQEEMRRRGGLGSRRAPDASEDRD